MHSVEYFNKYDEFAKQVAKKVLRAKNRLQEWYPTKKIEISNNTDKYGVDLIVSGMDGEVICYVECEVGTKWLKKFPFDVARLLNRKFRYLTYDKPVYIFQCDSNGEGVIMYKVQDVLTLGRKTKLSNYVTGEEDVYELDVKHCWQFINTMKIKKETEVSLENKTI